MTRPHAPPSPATAQAELAGSPAPLSALHQQAGRLLGAQSALSARLHALRGYPVIVNAWASWCTMFAQRVIDAGAAGFVLKDRADSELPDAVRCAARGEEYVSPRIAAGVAALLRADNGDALSPRESEVLRLLGLTTRHENRLVGD